MRVTSPLVPTIQTFRGAQFRSTYQTFSGSGIDVVVAPRRQPVTCSEPQITAGPEPQAGSRVSVMAASAVPDSFALSSPRYITPCLKMYVCDPWLALDWPVAFASHG